MTAKNHPTTLQKSKWGITMRKGWAPELGDRLSIARYDADKRALIRARHEIPISENSVVFETLNQPNGYQLVNWVNIDPQTYYRVTGSSVGPNDRNQRKLCYRYNNIYFTTTRKHTTELSVKIILWLFEAIISHITYSLSKWHFNIIHISEFGSSHNRIC